MDVLLDGFQSDGSSHSVGALRFDGAGRLLASFGDGSDYSDVDPRALRTYDLGLLNGKVVRIDPDTGLGVPDNPYFDALNSDAVRSKVLARGLRNPSRFVPDTETDAGRSATWAGVAGRSTTSSPRPGRTPTAS